MKIGQRPSAKGLEFEALREQQLDREPGDFTAEEHEHDWMPRNIRVILAVIMLIVYPILLILYYFNRENVYKWGEDLCNKTSKWGGTPVYWYAYVYANYFDRFVPIGGCFLLMVGVEKATTLKGAFVLMMAMHSRNWHASSCCRCSV